MVVPDKNIEPGILDTELLFQRFLSSPKMKWSTKVRPYIVDTAGAASDEGVESNLQIGIPRVIIDIEDVKYDTVSLFTGNKIIAKNYGMFIRCLDYPANVEDESRADIQLKRITDDICRALQTDDHLYIYKEWYLERMGLNNSVFDTPTFSSRNNLNFLSADIEEFSREVENYPDLEELAGYLIYPYHVTLLHRVEDQIIIPDSVSDDMTFGKVNRIYGIYGRKPNDNKIYLQFYGAVIGGAPKELDESEDSYLLETPFIIDDEGNLVNNPAPNLHNEAVTLDDGTFDPEPDMVDIRPPNIRFSLSSTYYTFIDKEDVGRELRNEISITVKVNLPTTLP